jgi:hypothetical protein
MNNYEKKIMSMKAGTGGTPTPQVNADWNAASGVAKILNKPIMYVSYTEGGFIVEGFENLAPVFPRTGTYAKDAVEKHSGNNSLTSGMTSDGANIEEITLDVEADGVFSFWYKANAENGNGIYGAMSYKLDDVEIVSVEIVDWTLYSAAITKGLHVLKMVPNCNYGVHRQGWIDDISIPAYRTYSQDIQDHSGIPSFVGNGGKFLAIKADESGLEYITINIPL